MNGAHHKLETNKMKNLNFRFQYFLFQERICC